MENIRDINLDFEHDYIKIYLEIGENLISLCHNYSSMTIGELEKIVREYYPVGMLYIAIERGLSGVVYRQGNYLDGSWQRYAETQGYA